MTERDSTTRLRLEESVPLDELCVPIDRCLSVQPGPILEANLSALRDNGFDQAPVPLPDSSNRWGLVDQAYLVELRERGETLCHSDPRISSDDLFFHIEDPPSIYDLLHKMTTRPSVLVIEHYCDLEGLSSNLIGLLTIGDLNKHALRAVLYRLLASVEVLMASIMQKQVSDPWDWIRLLNEEGQARVLGYWELAKRKRIDIGPAAAANLTHLLTVFERSPALFDLLGFQSRRDFRVGTGMIPDLRNRIMHPVRPLILDHADVERLYRSTRCLEQLRNRLEQP